MTEEQIERWPLPRGWVWAAFEDVANIAQNLVLPKEVFDLPHIAPNHIGSGNRQLLPYTTVRADAVISPKQRFFPGQILFTKIRPYLLKSVLVDFEGVCSADMYPLWAKDTAEPKYLLYWLTSPDFRDEIALQQGRTVLPKINQTALNRSKVAVPPLPEQRRIVAKIDNLFAISKRTRDHLNHIPRLIEKYKQSILAAAFSGVLTQKWRSASKLRMKSWSRCSLDEIAEVGTGATPKRGERRFYAGGEIPWVTSGAVNAPIVRSAEEFITKEAIRETNCKVFSAGTLLMAMYGEGQTRGKVAVLGIDAATNQAIAAIQVKDGVVDAASDIMADLGDSINATYGYAVSLHNWESSSESSPSMAPDPHGGKVKALFPHSSGIVKWCHIVTLLSARPPNPRHVNER